jgi:hypothetical protein
MGVRNHVRLSKKFILNFELIVSRANTNILKTPGIPPGLNSKLLLDRENFWRTGLKNFKKCIFFILFFKSRKKINKFSKNRFLNIFFKLSHF